MIINAAKSGTVRERRLRNWVPGKTARAKGRRFRIKYNLLGGKKNGKLPSGYTYGKAKKIPSNAKKPGYSLLGWCNSKAADNKWWYTKKICSTQTGNIKLFPFWVKYRVEAAGNGSVKIFLDERDAVRTFGAFDVRYSTRRNMKKSKSFTMHAKGTTRTVRNLKKGKTYYFQVAYRYLAVDIDMDDDGGSYLWVGKRRVKVW